MTTRWRVPPALFAAETVAVLARGPRLTQEFADDLRGCRRIAVNDAYRLAPDADMLFAHDLSWWRAHPDAQAFAGLKVSGQAGTVDALFLPMPDEMIGALQVRNSGLMAVRIAAAAGAVRILLCGFDPEREPDHYPGLAAGLKAITSELRAHGIEVDRTGPVSKQVARA